MAEYHGDVGWSAGPFYKADNARESVIALILWFFFGFIGVHRFYQSKPLTGLAQLTIFCIGIVFCAIFISGTVATLFAAALGIWLVFDLVVIVGSLL